MNTFVIGRSVDGGKTAMDYLSQEEHSWVESGAVAKWFHTAKEAVEYAEEHEHICKNAFIFPYDPVETLVNPSETDRASMLQNALKAFLVGG